MYAVTDPQGICLIINIRHYEPQSGLPERCGSDRDVERVAQLFGELLHFNVRVVEDLTGAGIADCLRDLVANHRDALLGHGSFVCVLMAHGSNSSVIGSDGVGQSVAELTSLVDSRNCPELANKPKVFLVHASRSANPRDPSAAGDGDGDDDDYEASPPFGGFFLRDTDFLVCFANTGGCPVFDDPESGSAFLQAVCHLVRASHKREHLDDILTGVNRHLKSNPVVRNGRQHYYVPEKVSSLTKKCYVDPGMAGSKTN